MNKARQVKVDAFLDSNYQDYAEDDKDYAEDSSWTLAEALLAFANHPSVAGTSDPERWRSAYGYRLDDWLTGIPARYEKQLALLRGWIADKSPEDRTAWLERSAELSIAHRGDRERAIVQLRSLLDIAAPAPEPEWPYKPLPRTARGLETVGVRFDAALARLLRGPKRDRDLSRAFDDITNATLGLVARTEVSEELDPCFVPFAMSDVDAYGVWVNPALRAAPDAPDPIVLWDHEGGVTEYVAPDLACWLATLGNKEKRTKLCTKLSLDLPSKPVATRRIAAGRKIYEPMLPTRKRKSADQTDVVNWIDATTAKLAEDTDEQLAILAAWSVRWSQYAMYTRVRDVPVRARLRDLGRQLHERLSNTVALSALGD